MLCESKSPALYSRVSWSGGYCAATYSLLRAFGSANAEQTKGSILESFHVARVTVLRPFTTPATERNLIPEAENKDFSKITAAETVDTPTESLQTR